MLSYLSYPPTRNNLGILKHSHYLRAISIVCRSIRSNNGSNQTITAGLRFLALQLIACYAPGRINSSIDLLGSGSVHVSGPVAATFPSTPLISNNVGPVKLFLSTLLFSLKRVFLFRFLSALHRRPRLVRNLAGGFSPTQTSLRSKLRP